MQKPDPKHPCCQNCRFSFEDTRPHPYTRQKVWFCRRKGPFFSRNHRPGEGARILPEDTACHHFEPKE